MFVHFSGRQRRKFLHARELAHGPVAPEVLAKPQNLSSHLLWERFAFSPGIADGMILFVERLRHSQGFGRIPLENAGSRALQLEQVEWRMWVLVGLLCLVVDRPRSG